MLPAAPKISAGSKATLNITAWRFHAAAGATTAQAADDRVICDTTTGILYYDADGLGTRAAIAFAKLNGQPALTAADILLI